ncbi:MAG: type I secretion system permease/ATPase [Rhizobiaceae bacterium]|nr:type I secretion system permease/ATPase [Rhizobiaceae bacterium]
MKIDKKKLENSPALQVYRASLTGFFTVGIFSFFINLGALISPLYMQQIFDRVMQSRHVETLIYLTIIVVFFLVVIAILDGIRGSILAKIAKWWDETVNPDLLVSIIQMARSKGMSQAHAMNDLMSVRQFVGGPGILPFFDGPWMPMFIFAIALIHPWLSIIAVVAAFLLFFIAGANDIVTRRQMDGLSARQARAQTTVEVANRHADSVYSMGMMPGVLARFNEDNAFVSEAMYQIASFTAKISAFSKFIRFTAQISVLGLGAYLATDGKITSGGMIAASILMGRALAPAEQALGAWRGLIGAIQAHKRIRQLILSAPSDMDTIIQPEPRGEVEFNNASYVLSNSERPILRGLNYQFPTQSIIAVIGASGSGKSTMCKILIGALVPTSGSVRLDGTSMSNWDKTQFGKNIGYLAQSVQLMDGTIQENIARMNAANDEAVIEAAQIAGCHEMINGFPQGYQTVIGTHGMNLSGGQAQRIGFARALYGNPRLVVLDEPNSNLDADGDTAMHAGILKMKSMGASVFIVSHKPAVLANVDLIVTMSQGAIEKVQSKEEFMKNAIRPIGDMLEKIRKVSNARQLQKNT